ncbi:MAG: M23 family metallopeptidase [Anaerolineae bacterium]
MKANRLHALLAVVMTVLLLYITSITVSANELMHGDALGRSGAPRAGEYPDSEAWQSYIDPKFGFSLKFPTEWETEGGTLVDAHALIWEVRFVSPARVYQAVVVTVRPSDAPSCCAPQELESLAVRYRLPTSDSIRVNAILAIDGLPALELTSSSTGLPITYFTHGGYVYSIELQEIGDNPEDQATLTSLIHVRGMRAYRIALATFRKGNAKVTFEPPQPVATARIVPIADSFQFPLSNFHVTFDYNAHPEFWRGQWSDCFRTDKANLFHAAQDSGQPAGTPVYAVANGSVWYYNSNYSNYPGRVVIVRHVLPSGTEIYSMYGHLSTVAVQQSQEISKGSLIGTVLDQGSNSHLH